MRKNWGTKLLELIFIDALDSRSGPVRIELTDMARQLGEFKCFVKKRKAQEISQMTLPSLSSIAVF
jgi:hypothetical protein